MERDDEFVMGKNEDDINRVLCKIERIYNDVHLDKELVANNGGFCFGLLSPTTNILINSVISAASTPPLRGGGHGGGRDMNQRSLDGLITFLTCLFPYLPNAAALAYLDAADADPLVAALLVINRRGLRRFGFSSVTTVAAVESALRCAAVAADHPDPRRLVLGWKLLSRDLNNVVAAAAADDDMKPDSIVRRVLDAMRESSDTDLQLKKPWELAVARLDDGNHISKELLPPARGAMKRVLLATIHGFYLQAMARLPAAELRDRYHRSLLEGGYCYGPLDPVSNIIVDTVRYDQSFLASSNQVTLDMISTTSLQRAAARSLYGLMSFLCTRYTNLSPDQALQRLVVTGADLQVADPKLFYECDMVLDTSDEGTKKRIGELSTPSTNAGEAYAAAATAAFHPNPAAQGELLGSSDAVSKLKVASGMLHLQDGRMLSCDDLEFLSVVLLNCPSSVGKPHLQEHVPAPAQVGKRRYAHRFWNQHERVRSKVAAALDKYNESMVPKYRLHVICGVNELVSSPEFSMDMEEVGCYNPCIRHEYHHSHINFLATREGSECAGASANLFFAECSNHTGTWCVPMSLPHPDAEQVRCIYCEHQRIRVVHPDERNFHGRDEFEKLFYGSDRTYDNDNVIMKNTVDWVHDVKNDAIFCNHGDDDDDREEDEFMMLQIS